MTTTLSTYERFERLKLPPQVISVSRSGTVQTSISGLSAVGAAAILAQTGDRGASLPPGR